MHVKLVGPRKEKLEGEAKHYETTTMPQSPFTHADAATTASRPYISVDPTY
jgi:hypothetical protein